MMSAHDDSSIDLSGNNVLSKSLMNDTGFWRNFLKDESFSEKDNIAKETADAQGASKYSVPEDKLKCQPVHVLSKQVRKYRFHPIKHTETSCTCNKSYKYVYSRNKDELPFSVLFLKESYLFKIRAHIENYLQNKVPVLLIKDILKAKSYSIFGELHCRNLCEIDGLVCKNIICRGTVIGLVNKYKTFTILVSDGTASLWCKFHEGYATQQNAIDNSAIITYFESTTISYKTITAPCDIERGTVIQALGALDIYNKVFIITKLCSESKVVIRRELSFFNYIENCSEKHVKWKRDIANIYKP